MGTPSTGGMLMDTWLWVVIIAAVVIVVALVVWAATRKKRSDELRERFGPEYDRALTDDGAGARASPSSASGWSVTRRSTSSRFPRTSRRATGRSGATCRRGSWTNLKSRFTAPTV